MNESSDADGPGSWTYQPPPPFAPPAARQGPYSPPPYPQDHLPDHLQAYEPGYPHPALYGGYGTARRSTGRERGIWIGVLCLLLALAGGIVGITALSGDGSDPAAHHLQVPESFTGYELVPTQQSSYLERLLRDRLAAQGSMTAQLFGDAEIGIYAEAGSSSPSLVFIGLDADTSTYVADTLLSGSAEQNADSFLRGATVTEPTPYPTGPLGGALECGTATAGALMCVWADHSTLGAVLNQGPAGDAATLASTALALRTAAEH